MPFGEKLFFVNEAAKVGILPITYHQKKSDVITLHTHDFFEIFFVLKGQGNHRVDDEVLAVRSGDLFFVNHQKPHTILATSNDLWIANLCFLPSALGYHDEILRNHNLLNFYDLLAPFRGTGREGVSVQLRPPENLLRKITFSLFWMSELFFDDAEKNREGLRSLLSSVLHILLQELRQKSPDLGRGQILLIDALDWIQGHYREKISLAHIVQHYGVSKSHFSTVFNRTLGKNLNEYVNALRIEEAKRLLQKTRLPVSAIAVEIGFETLPHFSAVFRKLAGLSPKAFREKKISSK